MTLTAPINPKSMVSSSAEFHLAKKWSDSLIRLGVYKDPDITPAGETVDDKYSNWTGKKVKDGNKLTLKFALHEQNPEVLAIIEKGLVEYKTEVATVTGRVESYNPGEWGYDNDILLEKANASGTVITPTKVEALIAGSWVELDTPADYTFGVTTFGKTFVALKSGGQLDENSPKAVSIRVTYNATPDATVKYAVHNKTALAKPFVMVVEWKRTYDGEDVGILLHLEGCTATKSFIKPVSDDDGTTSGYAVEVSGIIKKHEFINL